MRCLAAEDPHGFRVVEDHVVDGAEGCVGGNGDESGSLAGTFGGCVGCWEGFAGLSEEGFGYCVVLWRGVSWLCVVGMARTGLTLG